MSWRSSESLPSGGDWSDETASWYSSESLPSGGRRAGENRGKGIDTDEPVGSEDELTPSEDAILAIVCLLGSCPLGPDTSAID